MTIFVRRGEQAKRLAGLVRLMLGPRLDRAGLRCPATAQRVARFHRDFVALADDLPPVLVRALIGVVQVATVTVPIAVAAVVWVAAAAVMVLAVLIWWAGGTPLPPPQAHTEIAAAPEATPAHLAATDQATGRRVFSPIGIGWVGNSWLL